MQDKQSSSSPNNNDWYKKRFSSTDKHLLSIKWLTGNLSSVRNVLSSTCKLQKKKSIQQNSMAYWILRPQYFDSTSILTFNFTNTLYMSWKTLFLRKANVCYKEHSI